MSPISGAKKVIDIDGLPKMRIAGLRLTDVIGSGKVGLTARYADALELHHVQVNAERGPAFAIASASNLELDGVTTRQPIAGSPVVRLTQTPGAVLRDSRAFYGTGTFLFVGPAELKSLHLDGNVLANAAIPTVER